jgi:hypothetical protein
MDKNEWQLYQPTSVHRNRPIIDQISTSEKSGNTSNYISTAGIFSLKKAKTSL